MGSRGAMLEVNGVRAVKVLVVPDAAISSPKGPSVAIVRHAKRVEVLPETIKIGVFGERCLESEILRLKDEVRGGGVEENFSCRGPGDLEGEWRIRVLKRQQVILLGDIRRRFRARKQRFGYLVPLALDILDQNMKAVVWGD